MATGPPPPPPPLFFPANDDTTLHHHFSSSSVFIIILIISIIILSASIYYLIRFFSFRTTVSPSNDAVSEYTNENEYVISIDTNNELTFSSITGNESGGDCAVCLTKFEANDQLRRLPLCCHAFHVECIDPWLKSNHTCPLCRSTINPSEADIINIAGNGNHYQSNSLRITISRRPDPSESSVGSFEYVVDDSYEIPVESTHRRYVSGDEDEPPVVEIAGDDGGGRFLFTGSSRRSEVIDDYEAALGRYGEEISEYFRWLSGV